MTKQTNELNFVAGVAVNSEIYYIASSLKSDDDSSNSVMIFYQEKTEEKWFFHELPNWRVIDVEFPEPNIGEIRKIYALDENGRVETYSREGSTTSQIIGAGLIEGNRGYLNRLRFLNGNFYACGFDGQIYREAKGSWTEVGFPLDPLTSVSAGKNLDEILERMSSSSLRNIWDVAIDGDDVFSAFGSDGLIAQLTNGSWKVVKRLTSADLHSAHIDEQGTTWVVGSHGTIIKKEKGKEYEIIQRKNLDFDFHSICTYKGMIYIGADDGLYKLQPTQSRPIKVSIDDITEVSNVEEKDGVLWVLSTRKLLRFDGKNWEVFEHPNNVK